MKSCCQDQTRFDTLVSSGNLAFAIGRWCIGSREGSILRTLATAQLLAKNAGEQVPCPSVSTRTDWEAFLNKLVAARNWDRRCSDCQEFFCAAKAIECTVGLDNPIKTVRCPECGCTTHESIR